MDYGLIPSNTKLTRLVYLAEQFNAVGVRIQSVARDPALAMDFRRFLTLTALMSFKTIRN